ncbi:hypothetical protein [Alteromonas gracilis]|uniref:hypothetical protein n=1 Tax=Alteromonas gracilis TaxID=1479524 RepID=UPI0037364C1C
MRSIYKKFLTSNNLVVDALSIRDSINKSQCETLKKMRFLVLAVSDAAHREYGGESVSSVYSVRIKEADQKSDYFVAAVLSWPQLIQLSYSRGFCYLNENTRLMKADGYQYSEAAYIDQKQLHRLILTVEAVTENGIEWYSLFGNRIVEASERSNLTFKLPWLAQRNSNKLSPVDTASLAITDVIMASDGEVSFQLGEKILECSCPDYVFNHNRRIIACNKGLILRSKNHTLE